LKSHLGVIETQTAEASFVFSLEFARYADNLVSELPDKRPCLGLDSESQNTMNDEISHDPNRQTIFF
jgi:hypothetical protein